MSKSKSSHQWLQRHVNDEFVKKAQKEGYRSRATYKLLEIQERDRLIKPGQVVVDLGAAPGGWSQLAQKLVLNTGEVIALDILPMDPLPGVTFIQGDFTQAEALTELESRLSGRAADLVISDIAPNMSGVAAVDQPKTIYLCELALDFARQNLKPKGDFLVKVFQGEGFDAFLRDVKSSFQKVTTRKPRSSRSNSREVYLVARNFIS